MAALAATRREGGHKSGINGPADRRERHRQGSRWRRSIHYSSDRASTAVHEHHLFGAAGTAARERALRPRARRVHRCEASRSVDCWRRRMGAPSFSTRSARWCRRCRRSCCGFSRRKRSSGSAGRRTSASTSAWSRRRTAISKRRSPRGASGAISIYRLNVLPISIPPLRAHAEDVPLLVEYFIDSFNAEFRKRVVGSSPAAYTLLRAVRMAWQRARAAKRRRARDAALR